MDVSVIILTRNAGERFAMLLHRLYSQTFPGDFEIIVIDSGSTDETLETARRFPVTVIGTKAEEFGHGRTRNIGAEQARGKTIAYITQDALPLNDNWLHKLTEDFQDPQVAMVVGRQIPWETTKPPEKYFYSYYFPEHRIEVVCGAADYYRDNMFISNVNSAIRKDIWQHLRFSEEIVQSEDKEIAKRMLYAGWKIVYRPDAAVYHGHDFTLRTIFQKALDAGRALSQGANVPRSKNWAIRKLAYFAREPGYIVSGEKAWKWLPYSAAYEASRLLGVIVGWLRGRFLRKA